MNSVRSRSIQKSLKERMCASPSSAEVIVVETTGLAEPEALAFNIQEALPQCRLDGVVSVVDADMLVRFPELGHTTRLQIEGADILLLNKIDLVEPSQPES